MEAGLGNGRRWRIEGRDHSPRLEHGTCRLTLFLSPCPSIVLQNSTKCGIYFQTWAGPTAARNAARLKMPFFPLHLFIFFFAEKRRKLALPRQGRGEDRRRPLCRVPSVSLDFGLDWNLWDFVSLLHLSLLFIFLLHLFPLPQFLGLRSILPPSLPTSFPSLLLRWNCPSQAGKFLRLSQLQLLFLFWVSFS